MSYIDMHCDTISCLMEREGESLFHNHLCVNLKGMKEAQTIIQFFACFVHAASYDDRLTKEQRGKAKFFHCIHEEAWDQAYKAVLAMADRIDKEQGIIVAKTYKDVQENLCKKNILAWKTVEEGGVLNLKLDRLNELYNRGIRLVTLTWNFPNCIGYPNSTDSSIMQKGLTKFGIETVEKMNELGMMIDVSHLSDGGFYDCIRYSKKPVCASHSNARVLCQHPRNLSDEMLKQLGEKGGVAGLNFCTYFLKEDEKVTVDNIAEHAAYMIEKGGEDLVAIGSDFDGFDNPYRPNWVNRVEDMPLLWEAFRRRGISERQIDKIMLKNVLRFMKDTIF